MRSRSEETRALSAGGATARRRRHGRVAELTVHDPDRHLALREDVGHVEVVGVRAAVDDPVHVEVQVVEFREQRRVGDDLVDFRIAFADPSVKLKGATAQTTSAVGRSQGCLCKFDR